MMVDYDRFFMKTFVNKHSILKTSTAIYWLKTNSFLSFILQSLDVTYETTALFFCFALVFADLVYSSASCFSIFQICVINHIHFIIVITF